MSRSSSASSRPAAGAAIRLIPELQFSPGVGVDYWIWAHADRGIGSTLTGINFVVTIYKMRAPGMTLMRMPLFTWTALAPAS